MATEAINTGVSGRLALFHSPSLSSKDQRTQRSALAAIQQGLFCCPSFVRRGGKWLKHVVLRYGQVGRMLFSKERYQGEWKDGKFHGRGKYTWADGAVYEGEFQDGEFHGRGKVALGNGAVYEGEFQDGKFHGRGKVALGNGAVYEGEFQDGKFHGRGKYTWADGTVYEGEFVLGIMVTGNVFWKGHFFSNIIETNCNLMLQNLQFIEMLIGLEDVCGCVEKIFLS